MTSDLKRITLGSAFRMSWVNSGATANPISFNIQTGSETLVASYAGVDSGNGHYYVDASINPASWGAGVYRGRWYATVSANTYANDLWLEAYPQQTDQPGRYITWDDVVARYADFATTGGAVKAASHYISAAEARIDAMLAPSFTTPFSNNNTTVRDLSIDMTYLLAARLGEEEHARVRDDIKDRIKMLRAGDMTMILDTGVALSLERESTAWSSTMDYNPVFSLLDPLEWAADSAQLSDEVAARG